MLGRDLLVATVIEEGATIRRLYLPGNGSGWWDFHTGTFYAGGQMIELPVDPGSIPLFVRAGAALPLSRGEPRARPETDLTRRIALFPAPGSFEDTALLYEDDGVSADALAGNNCQLRIRTRALPRPSPMPMPADQR